jgi:hypothetical protein
MNLIRFIALAFMMIFQNTETIHEKKIHHHPQINLFCLHITFTIDVHLLFE